MWFQWSKGIHYCHTLYKSSRQDTCYAHQQIIISEPIGKAENHQELANQRQATRAFTEQRVSHETLMECVRAVQLAPSACNSQPWKFVVVETPELVKQVTNTWRSTGICNKVFTFSSLKAPSTQVPNPSSAARSGNRWVWWFRNRISNPFSAGRC